MQQDSEGEMQDTKKQAKHAIIAQAAYDLLEQKGYSGTSMLSIAKAAKASNETLYRWYGDKHGLFMALVSDNAAQIETTLTRAITKGDAKSTLDIVAPMLLEMLLGERAISLNRAAAGDPSGELGRAISAKGRDVIQPLISQLMAAAGHQDLERATAIYLSLLIGDLQIKRVIGVMNTPSKDDIAARCAFAKKAFAAL